MAALALPDADDGAGETRRVVAMGVDRVHEVVQHEPGPARRGTRGRPAQAHGLAQPARRRRGVEPVVREHDVRQPGGAVALQGVDVVGEVVATGLARLRRHVAGEHDERPGRRDRLADPRHEQGRQDAGVEAPGADHDDLGLLDRVDRVLARPDVRRGDPDAVDGVAAGDEALAVHHGAVQEPGVEAEDRAGGGDDPAAHREDAVHLPDPLLEVPVLEGHERGQQQVAHRVPAEADAQRLGSAHRRQRGVQVRVRLWRQRAHGAREPVLEQAAHERLGVGEGDDAVADVPDGRQTQLRAQHARRAAVIRHGDDRGEVGGVLLEAAQQRGEAGPAADGHDARAAGEEPLLVDDLDHRLVAVPEGERVHQRPHEPVGAVQEQREANGAGDEPAQVVGQELQGEEVDHRHHGAARLHAGHDLADDVGDTDGEDEEPEEREEEPPLDADADGQPAAEVHRSSSRWKTATGPKSRPRSQAASSSLITIERCQPPVQPMAMVRRVLPSRA